MHRIDGPGATPGNLFTEGDPVGGVAATTVTAAWMNDVQENLMAVLAAAGVTPTKGRASDLLDSVTGRLIGVRRVLASGVYNETSGTKSIIVDIVAGGGGGAGVAATAAGQNSCAGGGGSGARTIGRFTSGFSGVMVTIGAAGAGGAIGASGSTGGTSSFGSLLSVGGGAGGATTTAPSPYGAVGGGGGVVGTSGNIFNGNGQ